MFCNGIMFKFVFLWNIGLLRSNRFLILKFPLNQMFLFRSTTGANLIWISPKQKTMLILLFFLSIKILQKKNGNHFCIWQESVLLLKISNLLQVSWTVLTMKTPWKMDLNNKLEAKKERAKILIVLNKTKY